MASSVTAGAGRASRGRLDGGDRDDPGGLGVIVGTLVLAAAAAGRHEPLETVVKALLGGGVDGRDTRVAVTAVPDHGQQQHQRCRRGDEFGAQRRHDRLIFHSAPG